MGLNSGLEMATPILTWQGRVLDLSSELYSFNQNILFVIHEGEVPNSYSKHHGLLWECGVCGKCSAAKKNIGGKCKKGHPHKLLFPDATPVSWGSRLDVGLKPFGCPAKLKGTGPKAKKVQADTAVPPVQQAAPTAQASQGAG